MDDMKKRYICIQISGMFMKPKYGIFLFFFGLVSCTGTKRLVDKDVKVSKMSEMAYFEPLAYISIIEKGNRAVDNDSLSAIAAALLDTVIAEYPLFRNKTKMEITDPKLRFRVAAETNNLVNQILATKQIEGIPVPTNIASLIKDEGYKYYMGSIVTGFGRKAGNYGKQVAKAIGVGILTLGMYAPVPLKSSINLFTFIIDAEANKIVYFSRTWPLEESPTNKKTMIKQYKKAVSEYF